MRMAVSRFAPEELRGLGRALWIAAVVFAALFTLLAGLFTAGYAMDDPGGLVGVGLILLWLVPIAVGAALAWWRPELAYRILLALTVFAVAIGLWQLIDPMALHEFENRYGPITAIGSFAGMLTIALVARIRMWQCALMMLVIALMLLVPDVRSGMHLGSSGAVALPMLLDASLLGLAAALAPRR